MLRFPSLPLLLAAAGALSALPFASARAQQAPGLTVGPCEGPGYAPGARCGTLEVWENRATRQGRKIPIYFMVIPATGANPSRDPIVPIAGGPGEASTGMAGDMLQLFAPLRDTHDVLAVDQRGSGKSNFLGCRLYGPPEDPQSYLTAFMPAERVRACVAELQAKADLTQYTSDAAADDMDEVRAALGYEKLNLYGGSYGTRAALVYMRRHPEHVRSALLHGVVPTDDRMPMHTAPDAERSLQGVFAECAAEPACRAAFPDLPGDMRKVLERLAGGPVEVEILHPRTVQPVRIRLNRDLFGEAVRYLMYGSSTAGLVPLMVHQAAEGDLVPIAEFALYGRMNIVDSGSNGLYLGVTCAEDVPFVDAAEGERLAQGTFLGGYRVRDQLAACAAWPKIAIDPAFRGPVVSDAPTLLISGEWDPATPPAQGEQVARTLRNALHVVVPSGGHGLNGLVGMEQCLNPLMVEFVRRASVEGLDTSCVASIHRPPFPTVPFETREVSVPAADLARLAGDYSDGSFTVKVTQEGSRLRMTLPWTDFTLVPVSPTRFRMIGFMGGYANFQVEGGQGRTVVVESAGATLATLQRVGS